jgi:thioesterase domain-containing protein
MKPEREPERAERPLPKLFCLMGEDLYGTLARHLAGEVALVGMYDLRELGLIARARRDGHEAGGFSIQDVAPFYLERIRAAQPWGPYMLGGFSAGGAVALEVAHRLRALGEEVALLVLFDTVAYRHLRRRGRLRRALVSARLALDGGWHGLRGAASRLARRIRARIAARLPGHVRASAARPRPSREELQELRLQYFQAALLEYEPGTYEGRVLLFTSLDAERNHDFVIEDHLGWRDVVRGELSIDSFPGDHVDLILSEPNASVVADRIARAARQALDVRRADAR